MICLICENKMKLTDRRLADANTEIEEETCGNCGSKAEITRNLRKYGRIEKAEWKRGKLK